MDGLQSGVNSMIDKAAVAAQEKVGELLGGKKDEKAAEQGIGDKISGAIGDAVTGAAADKAADSTVDNVMSFGSSLFK